MEEIWKDIEGYEGLYQVSNLGNVKSLGNDRTRKDKILKPGGKKYLQVVLTKNKETRMFLVHRLVANAFIQNPNNLPDVNHIDENPKNNTFENLEFCDRKYNINFGSRNERVSKSMTNNNKISTPIKCINLETKEMNYYPSMNEVARQFNIKASTVWRSMYKYNVPYKNKYIFIKL